MSEVEKYVVQLLVTNLPLVLIIILFILSLLFKISRREIDPLGATVRWLGKKFTKDVRDDVAQLKKDTETKFEEVKRDRGDKVTEMMEDYNKKISVIDGKIGDLRTDLDGFEERTNSSIDEMKKGTDENCQALKQRMNEMEAAQQKSNDLQTIGRIRAHVLDFANSCYNHREHTRLEFENIIEENTQYKVLVKKHDIENDVYKEDFEYIMSIYHKCQREHSFLNEKGVNRS